MELSAYWQRFDKNQVKKFSSGLGAPIILLAIMGMVILPMPPFLLDVLFSFNIALSLVILLVAVLTKKPVDFGIFPCFADCNSTSPCFERCINSGCIALWS